MAKRCRKSSDKALLEGRFSTIWVARWFTVSRLAATHSLFNILTSCCVPPWHRAASVMRTCSGALAVALVQNTKTEIAKYIPTVLIH